MTGAIFAVFWALLAARSGAQVLELVSYDAPLFRSAGAASRPLSSYPLSLLLPAGFAPLAPTSAAPVVAAAAPALFDEGTPASDQAPIYPRLVAPSDAPRPEFAPQMLAARLVANGALASLRQSVALGNWNGEGTRLDGSCCGDAAPKLAVLLRGRGLPARLVEAEFHYYVLLDLPGGQIVIDPTIRQFFGGVSAPAAVPTVFVGTIGELRSLFVRQRLAKTTKYEPDRIYFSSARDRESRLAALERDVQSGSAPEHAPLRLFLAPAPRARRGNPLH